MRGARLRVRVTLVHEAAADRTRAAVQVLVTAPHGEVGLRLVEREQGVADGMREVESHHAAVAVRRARDTPEVERLTGAKLHSRPQHQGDLLSVAREALVDRLLGQRVLAGGGCELDQGRPGIEAPPGDLGCDRVAVGGERARLHQDARAPARRAVEAREHQVQVHGERVHRDHLQEVRAGERCEAGAQILVIRHPRTAGVLVSDHAEARPVLELLFDELSRRERHEPERVTAQVHERLAALIARQREALAEAAQRVRGIPCPRSLARRVGAHEERSEIR